MAAITDDITAYDQMRHNLELESMGKWVVFHDRAFVGTYESMEDAAEDAVKHFGRGPYLIRQIGAPPVTLPASVMYRPDYGDD
jgi:hypothetical protein